MIAPSIRSKVGQRVNSLITKTEELYGITIPTPKMRFTLRGEAAGMADCTKEIGALNFNPILLVENEEEFIEHTVGHEFAHVVTVRLHGTDIFKHGREWQRVMKNFGLPPKISHDYDTSNVILLPRTWKCDCAQHQVTQYMHNQLLKGAMYLCNNCGVAVKR